MGASLLSLVFTEVGISGRWTRLGGGRWFFVRLKEFTWEALCSLSCSRSTYTGVGSGRRRPSLGCGRRRYSTWARLSWRTMERKLMLNSPHGGAVCQTPTLRTYARACQTPILRTCTRACQTPGLRLYAVTGQFPGPRPYAVSWRSISLAGLGSAPGRSDFQGLSERRQSGLGRQY